MTHTPFFASTTAPSIPLDIIGKEGFDHWKNAVSEAIHKQVCALEFQGAMGQAHVLFNGDMDVALAVAGLGTAQDKARSIFRLAKGFSHLPKGTYHLNFPPNLEAAERDREVLGIALQNYRFEGYKKSSERASVTCPADCDQTLLENMIYADYLARDLINRPANNLGPAQLAKAACDLAKHHSATCTVIQGDELLKAGFPLVHTVGRAAKSIPQFIEITWGKGGPSLTLVGKGVCYDTGGLNLKPGAAMALMKKDMGGAASTLGLAALIMAQNMKLRLRVLIPAVENAMGGDAFRPGDVLTARNGTTIEINNTDAEGRLVLADALAYGAEAPSDLTISFATLTGAARVAVGSEIAPFFSTDDAVANAIHAAGERWGDPAWRLPFWDGYESMIEPQIADLDNAPKGGMAGAITAALFLRRFAPQGERYAHFDIHNWSLAAKPGRPVGAVAQAIRAVYGALGDVLKL